MFQVFREPETKNDSQNQKLVTWHWPSALTANLKFPAGRFMRHVQVHIKHDTRNLKHHISPLRARTLSRSMPWELLAFLYAEIRSNACNKSI